MTTVLGMNMSHYAAACLIQDGKIVATIGEERLNRIKFSADFPRLAIQKVMEIGGVTGKDIDLVAIGTRCETFDSNRAQAGEYRKTTRAVSLASELLPCAVSESWWMREAYVQLLSRVRRRQFNSRYLDFFRDLNIDPAKIHYFDHHESHAAVAYFTCPWPGERVLVLTNDGNGDGLCATVSIGEGDRLERKVEIPSIHSIGGLYARSTKFLGMAPWQDEYKVMGMAPWGAKSKGLRLLEEMRKLWVVDGLKFRNRCGYAGDALIRYLRRKFPTPRFDHMSFALQALFEEIMTGWVRNNVEHWGIRRIAASGGVFLNVKANKKILELPQVEEIFVFPAAGDDSITVGAAILGYRMLARRRGHSPEVEPLRDVYWGEPIDAAIERLVRELDPNDWKVEKPADIEDRVAELLAANEIVARCAGRMEFGPRALGNRSILAHPGHLRNVQRLNAAIKCRDFWMPFAGTVLDRAASRYLSNPKGSPAHYMIMAFDSLPERRDELQCAIHQADHTIRPQILVREFNPGYYRLIEAFERRTGIGAVLNTSFNLHGEPIVNLPSEAIRVLERSALRYLALGPYLITKLKPDPEPGAAR